MERTMESSSFLERDADEGGGAAQVSGSTGPTSEMPEGSGFSMPEP